MELHVSGGLSNKFAAFADRMLPNDLTDVEVVRQNRTVLLGSIVGLFFATATAASYWAMGSPSSAASISLITVGLLLVAPFIRRGISNLVIGHVMTALTAQAAVVVTVRSGGLASPALSWFFMLPLISYLACGHRSSLGWAAFSLVAIGACFTAERAGVHFAQDFSQEDILLLRATGYPGVILSTAVLMWMVEGVRVASLKERDKASQTLERARLLRDMHDGVGGHLTGLLARAKTRQLAGQELEHGLQACLSDLRLVVDSLDPDDGAFDSGLADLRQRTRLQCESAGIQFDWQAEQLADVHLSPEHTLIVLRACQEMLTNALRHSGAKAISMTIERPSRPAPQLVISVADNGIGFDLTQLPRVGRGLSSLKARAASLGGALTVTPEKPGARVTLRFPIAGSLSA